MRWSPRSWIGGWDRLDLLVALALLTVTELHVWLGASGHNRVTGAIGGAVFWLPVAYRRRRPLTGVLVLLTALAVKTAVDSRPGALAGAIALAPALLLLFYGMGAFAPPDRSRWVFALALLVTSINTVVTPGKGPSNLPSEFLLVVLPYCLGLLMRRRAERERADRELAEQLDAGRDLHAATAVQQERSRIARELHDVVTHSVSVMVIQAGGARLVMDSEPDRAEASLRSVERAGRDALAEMRRLLGVLEPDRDPWALAPQPGLANLGELLGSAQSSGLSTELRVDGTPASVSPALDLCAYRIVQEAVTNAIKHAAPAHADVHIRWFERALELEISDDGQRPGSAAGSPGGHGIAGMRERAALHGGLLETGPRIDGGFRVHASLPIPREAWR